jgi:hypothetical protein
MKKVAATRGHKVRRADFFGETNLGWESSWRRTLAVANFDGSSSSDSLSATPRGLGASGFPVNQIPKIPLKLVRSDEITLNSRRCKKKLQIFHVA